MEEMLLRVCVVVFSLLYIKDRTVYQEQEENVIVDMQEREYLLKKEAKKLEQEVHQVTTALPHSNQEVLQYQSRSSNGEGAHSDVQQVMANSNVENSHERPMKPREDQDVLRQILFMKDIQDGAVYRADHSMPPVLQHGVTVDENFALVTEVQPQIVQASQNEVKNVQDDKTDTDQKTNMPSEDQRNSPLRDKTSLDLDQTGEMVNQMPPEDDPQMLVNKNTEEITEEEGNLNTSSQESNENQFSWYLWNIVSLISLIRLLRRFISKGSQNSATTIPMKGKTTSGSTGTLSKIFIPDQQMLNDFYDQCVKIPPSTCGRVCEFVEGFVDELLEAASEASNEETDMQLGDLIGVGSLYELWATGKTVICDLYVPIIAPKSHGFEVELCKEKDASLSGFGKIRMVKAENVSNGCPCMNGNSTEDVLCLLHTHGETSKVMTNAVGGPLCQENTPYLSKKQVVRWFRTSIINAWREISHKYEFELGFRNQVAPGALRVRFRSGQIVLFNITPVVQFKDSEVYLASYLSPKQNISDLHWPTSFAIHENSLLQYFNKTLPCNSCHIQCLQILSFLHKQQNILTGNCGLTSHHLKSTLLHLLMYKPTEWKREQLADRLIDMLTFLDQRLQAKEFHHALMGNSLVPKVIGLPREFQMGKPTNIFLPMVLDGEHYSKTVQHVKELVKNAPVLIQEFGSTALRLTER